MTRALIGHTGFVGGQLLRQTEFEATFNSTNIEAIRGRSFDLVACAGAPAQKWLANREPERDRASIDRLIEAIDTVDSDRFILISTVDVYPEPVKVTETTPIDNEHNDAYGGHRRMLEQFVESKFDRRLIVRLPGLFGEGLKKNVIHDLLHENRIEFINPASVFQFYDLVGLWRDIEKCLHNELDLINVATEPLSVGRIAHVVFGRELRNPEAPPAARYDMRSIHCALWGRSDGYLESSDEVLGRLDAFVRRTRSG